MINLYNSHFCRSHRWPLYTDSTIVTVIVTCTLLLNVLCIICAIIHYIIDIIIISCSFYYCYSKHDAYIAAQGTITIQNYAQLNDVHIISIIHVFVYLNTLHVMIYLSMWLILIFVNTNRSNHKHCCWF